MIARANSPLLSCTPEGDFETLQCAGGFPTTCMCVEPADGTLVGTPVVVASPDDIPDCDAEGELDQDINT